MSDRLVAPRILVLRDGQEPMEVQTDNRDLIRWENTYVRHKWQPMDKGPFKWLTFLAWSAATRTGSINGTTYEQWEEQVLSVRDTTEKEEDRDEEDRTGLPTLPGPAPG